MNQMTFIDMEYSGRKRVTQKEDCANCPYRDRFNPQKTARVTRVTISARTQQRAQKQCKRKTDDLKRCQFSVKVLKQFHPSLESASE